MTSLDESTEKAKSPAKRPGFGGKSKNRVYFVGATLPTKFSNGL